MVSIGGALVVISRVHQIIVVVFMIVVSVTLGSDIVSEHLPSHLHYPAYPMVDVRPGGPHAIGEFIVQPDMRMTYRVAFDATPRQWVADLLTLSIGDVVPWGPSQSGRMAVTQDANHTNTIVAACDQRLLIFNVPKSSLAIRDQPAKGYPDYRLNAEGDALVIRGRGRQWRFEYEPSIKQWLLRRIAFDLFRKEYVNVEYDATGRRTALILPNKEAVRFEYEHDHCTGITLPYQQQKVEVRRQSTGHVTGLAAYRGEAGKRMKALWTCRFAYDDSGRLTGYTNPQRHEYTIAREEHDEGPLTNHVRAIHLKRELDGSVWSWQQSTNGQRLSHLLAMSIADVTADDITDHVLWERSVMPLRSSTPKAKNRQVKRGRKSRQKSAQSINAITSIPLNLSLPTGLGATLIDVHHYDEQREGKKPGKTKARDDDGIERDSSGRMLTKRFGDGRTLRYVYASTGELEAVSQGEQTHFLRWDKWGRLVAHTFPDGSMHKWSYNKWGALEQATRVEHNRKTNREITREIGWRIFDDEGRVQQIKKGSIVTERHIRDRRGQLVRRQFTDGSQIRYTYDRLGRLKSIVQRNQHREDFTYQAGDRLATRTHGPAKERRITEAFDIRGRKTAENVPGVGRTEYSYDSNSRLHRVVHPDGKDTIYTYDKLGRIIEVRGTHQHDMRITYDKQGQRHVEYLEQPALGPVGSGVPGGPGVLP